jgi:hypothetical protein
MKRKYSLLAVLLFASPIICLAGSETSPVPVVPSCPQEWISFMPVIFFTVILVFTIFKLRKDKVALSDLLAEKDVPPPAAAMPVVAAPAVAAPGVTPAPAVAPAAAATNPPQSVSRFIAFISGLTTISLAVCITTFYMYEYFSNVTNIDLAKLSDVLLALGLGVIPYGVNKVSSAIK